MTTAARRIAATSEDGGHPCYQSRHMAWFFLISLKTVHYNLQYMFMLPLELMGPGGCCCHTLLARLQSESVLASGNGDRGIQLRPDARISVYSAFYYLNLLKSIIFGLIRPRQFHNSAFLKKFKCCVSFFYPRCSHFSGGIIS
jgi:hypothetical protein